MNALITPEDLIARAKVYKVIVIILHTTHVTQATSLCEV
jgi:hypothetical protein